MQMATLARRRDGQVLVHDRTAQLPEAKRRKAHTVPLVILCSVAILSAASIALVYTSTWSTTAADSAAPRSLKGFRLQETSSSPLAHSGSGTSEPLRSDVPHSISTQVDQAVDPAEIAKQRTLLEKIRSAVYSRSNPLTQAAGRPVVLHRPEPAEGTTQATTCAQVEAYLRNGHSASGCEICVEHYKSAEYLFKNYFSDLWPGGVCLESGALDGLDGSQSLFFDRVLQWEGLLVEANPVNFAKVLVNRPRAVKLEMALCSSDTEADGVTPRQLEFVGDYGGVVGAVGLMGTQLKKAFHGDRADYYNVSCGTLSKYLKLAQVDRIDFWSLDVEGAELEALEGVDWDYTAIWLILVEMNPTAGEASLQAVQECLTMRGFRNVTKLGAMNELWENPTYKRQAANGESVCG